MGAFFQLPSLSIATALLEKELFLSVPSLVDQKRLWEWEDGTVRWKFLSCTIINVWELLLPSIIVVITKRAICNLDKLAVGSWDALLIPATPVTLCVFRRYWNPLCRGVEWRRQRCPPADNCSFSAFRISPSPLPASSWEGQALNVELTCFSGHGPVLYVTGLCRDVVNKRVVTPSLVK